VITVSTAPTFDAFLSHCSDDKPAVEQFAHRLRGEGLNPWLDKWNLIPGEPWQPAIEDALHKCLACVVFVGSEKMGSWQHEEMRAAINRRVSQPGSIRVIPVLLPGASREGLDLPDFLTAATWVEFSESLDDAEAFHRLL
jgi:hypothetical protein